ncbi:MAG: esterase [Microbacterium sp.]|uniref:alpha/beta hydrolase n=1 Tax=Microbacterium sp. TaxID=51671 RepID=UPI000DB6C643|nr:alpha/beta fold hydrolase [Microbacterium sp.]PZU38690.1 MAG: esterase [Microbacterium sp.]
MVDAALTPALDPSLALWSGDPDGRPLLVLLHGYGADERDLFALVPHLPPDFAVAAVRAPLTPPFPAPGFSWYAIEGLGGRDPEGVTRGAERLIEWVDAHAAGAASIGLLGFSQGGAIALQALRLRPDRFAFAVNLSGYAAPGPLPGDAALAARRPPVFWGRGARDEVIPPPLIAHTTEWLPSHADLSGRVYAGLTHSVSEPELADVREFLRARLDADTSG